MNQPPGDAEVVQGNAVPLGSRRRRGPKTPAGRARVGLNAITHGISSIKLVLPGESNVNWETHRSACVDDLAPSGRSRRRWPRGSPPRSGECAA
jgi:hypothetical protein